MTVGPGLNNPSPAGGRRRSVGPGGVPLPHGGHKPPSRFGSVTDPNAGSFSIATANPMLYDGAAVPSDAPTRALVGQSRFSS